MFQLTNVIPEQIIFISRGVSVKAKNVCVLLGDRNSE